MPPRSVAPMSAERRWNRGGIAVNARLEKFTLAQPGHIATLLEIPTLSKAASKHLLLSLLDGTLRGPFAALRGAHPTSGSASRFELASVGRGTVLE
jgi:hypothetical protein